MEELTLATPSLLFSAVSLIMLAYTNRFLSYAQVIRNLKKEFKDTSNPVAKAQIDNLRERLYLTRSMQILGITSLLLCVACMFFIYIHLMTIAIWVFGIALLFLIISLALSIKEIVISAKALELHLEDIETKK
ncbi:MAG: DUF2721 domain-containing protein [Bacteroidales bacterium]